jgi:hypothetical protein
MVTLDLTAAAALLKIDPATLRARASAGKIPGAKIGRSWVFVEADLIIFIQGQYRACLSTSHPAVRTGRSASRTTAGSYVDQLEQLIDARRKRRTSRSSSSSGVLHLGSKG